MYICIQFKLIRLISSCNYVCIHLYIYIFSLYEHPPKPPTIRNSYTRTLVLDIIMKLSGTMGVTQKTMTFDTHVCQIFEFEDIHPAS